MQIIVEGRPLNYWSWGTVDHMAKACPSKMSSPSQTAAAVMALAVVSSEQPGGECKVVGKMGQQVAPQQEVFQ